MKHSVTCLCPTYGRFHLLRQSVACFLIQDYPYVRLLILNDSQHPIRRGAHVDEIEIINADERYPNLGAKRQALLEETWANYEAVAHWDDDDLYLPWHLGELMARFNSERPALVQPSTAWIQTDARNITYSNLSEHPFEGTMVIDREAALRIGYFQRDSGQCLKIWRSLCWHRQAVEVPEATYIYRWGFGGNVSQPTTEDRREAFAKRNTDFSDEPLIPCSDARDWAMEFCKELFTEFAREANRQNVGPCVDLALRLKANYLMK